MQFFADRVSKPMADYQVYRGDVFELVDQATRFVMTHIKNWVGTRETGNTAQVPTKFELPYDAVKEAIVNAVCHRDYTSNASVQVMLFSDRLEVLSPGPLPRGMTVEKLSRPHRSIPVNPLLANAMFLMGYIEHAGTGTEDIIDKCKSWGLSAPEWEDDGDFKVVLYRKNATENDRANEGVNEGVNEDVNEDVTKNLSNKERLVYALIKKNPDITNRVLISKTNFAHATIERAVKKLKEKSLIERVGSDKTGHWKVKR